MSTYNKDIIIIICLHDDLCYYTYNKLKLFTSEHIDDIKLYTVLTTE